MVLAAPLTSAALHISRELAAAKQRESAEEAERAPPRVSAARGGQRLADLAAGPPASRARCWSSPSLPDR